MKNTHFRVEDVFSDVFGKEGIPLEKITELNNFLA